MWQMKMWRLVMSMVLVRLCKGQETLVYSVTFRDFLPAGCMRKEEYEYALDRPIPGYGGLTNETYNEATSLMDVRITVPRLNNKIAAKYCPYWDDMRAGRISGHPDFEYVALRVGQSCTIGCEDTSARPTLSRMVMDYLQPSISGLPKPVPCREDGLCGEVCNGVLAVNGTCQNSFNPKEYHMSRSEYFKSWYNDDPVYNKRVGKSITLLQQENDPNKYVFDAKEQCTENCNLLSWNPLGEFVTLINSSNYMELYPDFRTAPAWFNSLEDDSTYSFGKYWYTTEIHSYFQFSGNETFRFDGDDDVWVFINGRLAVDLGGVHAREIGKVDLGAMKEYFNLTEGGIYPFDMYHAERHTVQSNFRLETTLATSCNVASKEASKVTFSTSNASVADYYTFGTSQVEEDGQLLRLASNASMPSSPSSVFLYQQQNVGSGFVTTFSFRLGAGGKHEGFAFVLHNRDQGLKNMPTSMGSGLNFRNLENSLAVVFDACTDRSTNPLGECDEQTVRVHFPKDKEKSNLNTPDEDTRAAYDFIFRPLDFKEETHTVRIEYLETPAWLQVYVDGSLYLRVDDINLQALFGGRNAYMGFTSATSESPANVDIFDWQVLTVQIDPSKTSSVNIFPDAQPSIIWGDGSDFADFTFQTNDLCGKKIEFGGFADAASAIFVETVPGLDDEQPDSNSTNRALSYRGESLEPRVIPALVVDNGDGSYSARLQTAETGTFALHVCYGTESCTLNVTLDTVQRDDVPQGLKVALVTPGEDAKFYAFMKEAAIVVPPTASPTDAPTVFRQDPIGDNSATKKVAIGGGISFGVFLLLAFVMFRYKRQWLRDKGFIADGKIVRMEKHVEYDGSDEYSTVGRDLLMTTSEILKEKTKTIKGNRKAEVGQLVIENEELKHEIRTNKARAQRNMASAANRVMSFRWLPTNRKEFSPPSVNESNL